MEPSLLAKHSPLVDAIMHLVNPKADPTDASAEYARVIDPNNNRAPTQDEFKASQHQVFSSQHAKNALAALMMLEQLDEKTLSLDPMVAMRLRQQIL